MYIYVCAYFHTYVSVKRNQITHLLWPHSTTLFKDIEAALSKSK